MRRSTLTVLLAATALVTATAHAADGPASSSAKSFMTDAIQVNLAEISLSREALQKADNADIKAYAQHIIDDHTANNEKATKLAGEIGVTPPTEPSLVQRGKAKVVSALSGSAFDKAYLHEMRVGHESAIKMFQKEAAAGDGAVSTYAGDTLPTLQQHLNDEQALAGKMMGK